MPVQEPGSCAGPANGYHYTRLIKGPLVEILFPQIFLAPTSHLLQVAIAAVKPFRISAFRLVWGKYDVMYEHRKSFTIYNSCFWLFQGAIY